MKYRATRTTLVRAEPSQTRTTRAPSRRTSNSRAPRTLRAPGFVPRGPSWVGSTRTIARKSSTAREPIQRDAFVQRCVIAEWTFNASEGIAPWVVVADYLIARAIVETNIENFRANRWLGCRRPAARIDCRVERLSSKRRRARGRLSTGAPRSSDPAGGRCSLPHAPRRETAERAARRCRQDPGQRSPCADAIRRLPRLPDR